MERVKVIGIDPGLVHTGAVSMAFDPSAKMVNVEYLLVDGIEDPALEEVATWANDHYATAVFIEAYRPRSNFASDAKMGAAVNELKRRTHQSTKLDNTGMKKVVKPALMQLLNVWSYPTTSHHQDLRSAARIGLYGALKNDAWNQVICTVIKDHLARAPWHVIRKEAS